MLARDHIAVNVTWVIYQHIVAERVRRADRIDRRGVPVGTGDRSRGRTPWRRRRHVLAFCGSVGVDATPLHQLALAWYASS